MLSEWELLLFQHLVERLLRDCLLWWESVSVSGLIEWRHSCLVLREHEESKDQPIPLHMKTYHSEVWCRGKRRSFEAQQPGFKSCPLFFHLLDIWAKYFIFPSSNTFYGNTEITLISQGWYKRDNDFLKCLKYSRYLNVVFFTFHWSLIYGHKKITLSDFSMLGKYTTLSAKLFFIKYMSLKDDWRKSKMRI